MSFNQKVRQTIQLRAESRCEYCHIPDVVTSHTYHIDHIIAIKHDGSDELSNLAWSCLHCNLHKGTDVASSVASQKDDLRIGEQGQHEGQPQAVFRGFLEEPDRCGPTPR